MKNVKNESEYEMTCSNPFGMVTREAKDYFLNTLNHTFGVNSYDRKAVLFDALSYSKIPSTEFVKLLGYIIFPSAGSVLKDLLRDAPTVYCLEFGGSMTVQAKNKISGRLYEKTLVPNQDFEYKFSEKTIKDSTIDGKVVGYEDYYLDHIVKFLNKYMDFILEKSVTSRIVCNDHIEMKIKDGEVCFTAQYAV